MSMKLEQIEQEQKLQNELLFVAANSRTYKRIVHTNVEMHFVNVGSSSKSK